MRHIVKVGNPLNSKIRNPHFRVYAYGIVQAGSEQVVVLFGHTPKVNLDNPEIIEDKNIVHASWKALMGGKWYGDFLTLNEGEGGVPETVLDEAFEILFDQADNSLKAVFAQQNI